MGELDDVLSFIHILDDLDVSEELKKEAGAKLHGILDHLVHALHEYWESAKAQTRGWTKVHELQPLSTSSEKRRIREESIEVRQVETRITKSKKEFIGLINSNASHERIFSKIEEIIRLYEHEFHDLGLIMDETKVLLHRTKHFLADLKDETSFVKSRKVKKKLEVLDHHIHALLENIQRQSLRELMDSEKRAA